MNELSVDIIVPTYRPGDDLLKLLDGIGKQSYAVSKVILINTEQQYFESVEKKIHSEIYDYKLEIKHILKEEFDHGRTRHEGVKLSDADVFICMTQDAVPYDEYMVEELIKPLTKGAVVSYARQVPRTDCNIVERYTRSFNYPQDSCVKKKDMIKSLGIKTYFCSNVCAAYRREIYNQLGGFIQKTIFNEDMIFAAKVIQSDYQIAYAAEARVIHSHNYTWMQQFHRNFDMGVSQAQHPEIFQSVSSEAEGFTMVKRTTKYLWDNRHPFWIIYFYGQTFFKYLGYLLGKRYKKLPGSWVIRFSDNKRYWNS